MVMEFLVGGSIRQLKFHLKKYIDDLAVMAIDTKNEDKDKANEILRTYVEKEIERLIEVAETRQSQGVLGKNSVLEEQKDSELENSNQFGYLGWLNKFVNLSDEDNSDIWL